MNSPKCDELDYIHFLVAAQNVVSNPEAARFHPCADTNGPVHDGYIRLLYRSQSDGNALWNEVKHCVPLTKGFLIIDNTTLNSHTTRPIELVSRHWSGRHHWVVLGINLINLLWTDGEAYLPCDFCIYDKPHDGVTENDHFRAMVKTVAEPGFRPQLLGFDSWYATVWRT